MAAECHSDVNGSTHRARCARITYDVPYRGAGCRCLTGGPASEKPPVTRPVVFTESRLLVFGSHYRKVYMHCISLKRDIYTSRLPQRLIYLIMYLWYLPPSTTPHLLLAINVHRRGLQSFFDRLIRVFPIYLRLLLRRGRAAISTFTFLPFRFLHLFRGER